MTSDAIPSQLNALLPQLGADAVKLLIPYLTQLDAETGQVLVKQGDHGTDVYFLLNGKFSVFEKIQINSSEVVLNVATFPGPGVLGEVSVMTATERTATVVVIERSDCLVLTQDKFNALVKASPQTGIELLKAFGAIMYGRQSAFQNKVRGNILRESLSIEAGIAKMARYTGRVSRTSPALAKKLFSDDVKGVNYKSD
ncbi:cyclic nucleotide-binding domain-containing protein [Pseudomonadales bacterium]|nr:cyclic nucleotide-binding domain-containing protein [Pseudomonadales bacterium]MDC0174362.1 cyclic nucleotide-binding domain-containing protein [Pseudomonadales bacterium]MDC1307382.1 cyclic nucleotide-binding domain-containing protein [Pseudomonadales bacterium]